MSSEPAQPKPWLEYLWLGLKILVAAILIGSIIMRTDLRELQSTWNAMQIGWLIPGALCFYITVLIQAARTWELVDRQIPFRRSLLLTLVQTVVGNLLATSAGIASFLAMMRFQDQLRFRVAISSVMLARVGDLIALFIILSIGVISLWSKLGPLQGAAMATCVGIAVLLLILFLLFYGRSLYLESIDRLANWQALPGVIATILRQLTATIRQMTPDMVQTRVVMLSGYSILNVVVGLGYTFCSMQMFRVDLNLVQVCLFNGLTQLIYFIPIHVFGGLGTYEVVSIPILNQFLANSAQIVPYLIGARLLMYVLNLLIVPVLVVIRR
ncbi:MAG: hypothetical protein Fur005_06060 [Roseiflexaceae bacterium]